MKDKTTQVKIEIIAEKGNKCWLNGVLTRNNPLTGHHIVPRREGGQTIKENIAPICEDKHQAFNELERLYPDLAREITCYLVTYRGDYDEQVTERIDKILSLVERKCKREHENKYKDKYKTLKKRR